MHRTFCIFTTHYTVDCKEVQQCFFTLGGWNAYSVTSSLVALRHTTTFRAPSTILNPSCGCCTNHMWVQHHACNFPIAPIAMHGLQFANCNAPIAMRQLQCTNCNKPIAMHQSQCTNCNALIPMPQLQCTDCKHESSHPTQLKKCCFKRR